MFVLHVLTFLVLLEWMNEYERTRSLCCYRWSERYRKTTIVARVCKTLQNNGVNILQTKEPTHRFDRQNEELRGDELADLIVSDRKKHLRLDILPALEAGRTVVSDRYVCSSLVYRKLDGIPFENTWQHNANFLTPHLNIVLVAHPNTVREWVGKTQNLTRFEREHSYTDELRLYEQASGFLQLKGYPCVLRTNDGTLEEISERIVAEIV